MATTKTTTTTTWAMRLSARPITASTTSGTTNATSTSPSTTPMTMLTSTIAWCTPCVERARRTHSFTLDVVSHLIGSRSESYHLSSMGATPWLACPSRTWMTWHSASCSWRHTEDKPITSYQKSLSTSTCSSHSFPSTSCTLDNPIVMESLCYSANKGGDDAYDVSTSLTSYESNFMAFSELNDSSGSFSYIIPSSDQDMDDVTLGKLLIEAHRGQADYFVPEVPFYFHLFFPIFSFSLLHARQPDRHGKPVLLRQQGEWRRQRRLHFPPMENDIPSHQNLLLQRYEERIEMLSQENNVSKICMDARFIHVIEIGQYFVTKDTEEQFFARAWREYTLPRSDESSQPKGWIQGNTIIGPVLEITTSCLYSKHGIEVRIWSLSEDNSQSWVRISHGLNKFVIDSNHNNTEIPADLPEE